jgi:hypothetical protein
MIDLKSFGIVANIRHAGTPTQREPASLSNLDETPAAEDHRGRKKKASRQNRDARNGWSY